MNILASIKHFVQLHFGDFFSSIEVFYFKNIPTLTHGIIKLGYR